MEKSTLWGKTPDRVRTWVQGNLLFLLVVVVYWPSLWGEFIWDDDSNVTTRMPLRSWHGLWQIWFEQGATQQYYPLTHSSFWLDYHLWGLNPLPFHLENVLLHACVAVMLWWILRNLKVPGAWLGACFFAVHPVNVESVAWITERKNVLSGVIYLGSLMAALKFFLPQKSAAGSGPARAADSVANQQGPWKFYWLALGLYLCALWAKTSTVALPVVILLLLWWKRSRIDKTVISQVIPFFIVGLIMGLITMHGEVLIGVNGAEWKLSWLERCLIASRNLWFYLGKLVWPWPLMFIYPRWVINVSRPADYIPLVGAVLAFVALWRWRNGWSRSVLFALGYFVAVLFPLLGFFKGYFFRYSFVLDHFQYLACMGPLALAGAGLSLFLERFKTQEEALKLTAGGVLALTLGLLTWQQTGIYRNMESLWRDSVEKNPDAWMAQNNLGLELVRQNKTDEAILHFQAALRVRPNHAAALYNLGDALLKQGNVDEAILRYQEGLRIEPNYAPLHSNLGNAFIKKGDMNQASSEFQKAIAIQPDYVPALYNLGVLLIQSGHPMEATNYLQTAARLDAKAMDSLYALGNAMAAKGRFPEAIACYEAVVAARPDRVDVRLNLGNAYAISRRAADAIAQYQIVLRANPSDPSVHNNLGILLYQSGRADEAVVQYTESIKINFNNPEAHYNLGTALVQLGRRTEAAREFAEALRLRPNFIKAQQQLNALQTQPDKPLPHE
jgi:tetratricopeptide (TPR) repeat protein